MRLHGGCRFFAAPAQAVLRFQLRKSRENSDTSPEDSLAGAGATIGSDDVMKGQVEVLEARHGASRALDEEARQLFEHGAEQLEAERFDEALASLRRAHELAPGHAQLRSMLGLAIAHAERDFEQARALCESATKQEFFNPDLYLNLSRVYLEFDRRSEAMRYLRRGQMIDPGHAVITEALFDLGRRRPAVVPFLPRRHPLNRALGSARNLVLNGFGSR